MILKTLCLLYFVKCLVAEVEFKIEPPSPIVAMENTNFYVKCIAVDTSGKTINMTTDFKAGSNIIQTSGNHTVVTTTYDGSKTIIELNISGIQNKDLYDQKTLICATKDSQYQADVYILPENNIPTFVNDGPTSFSSVYGSDLSFRCSVVYNSVKTRVDIEWSFDGLVGSNCKNTTTAVNTTLVRSDVVISPIKYSNGGKYTCIAKLYIGSAVVKRYTKIYNLAEISSGEKERSKEHIVKAGSSVTLVCDIAGYPPPKFVWKKKDLMIDNNTDIRYTFRKDNSSEYETLTIADVTYTDRAEYKCILNFNSSEIVKSITLRVRDPLNALWPAIGILIEAVLLAIVIFTCETCKKSRQGKKDYKMKEENEETSPLVGNSPAKIVYSGADDSVRLRSSKEIVA